MPEHPVIALGASSYAEALPRRGEHGAWNAATISPLLGEPVGSARAARDEQVSLAHQQRVQRTLDGIAVVVVAATADEHLHAPASPSRAARAARSTSRAAMAEPRSVS